ncbi:type II secretion system F family protein [Mycolicibacterium komossense]|uniref:Type II secretion system F family protein n=1 Tax=Mycolicibacterium komossense TaxID=1779 RepID=A0ABT3CM31_9MYCO|nr:type II secretion system F family protein [Mycolicibacterium komossense]MCV7230456.1 type II secretion system F family protein [Mycolicibacterium komossense]
MSVAALALALALLISVGPLAVQRRVRTVRPPAGRTSRTSGRLDPLADAASLDVLAVCLDAGMAVPAAARATATSAPPQLAALLRRAGDLLALGADPAVAWTARGEVGLGVGAGALLRLARRSAASGAVLARGVSELAAETRQDVNHNAAAAAERASVVIAGPLGLCFLPAFVCLGLIPVVAGLASDVLGSGLV